MHSYPCLLIEADDAEEAFSKAEDWVNENLAHTHFDYGGPVEADRMESGGPTLPQTDPKFKECVRGLLKTERDVLWEHWNIIRQGVLKYAACMTPPSNDKKVKVAVVKGIGLEAFYDAGHETTYDTNMGQVYYSMYKFHELEDHAKYGRKSLKTPDFTLANATEYEVEDLLADGASFPNVFLVMLDMHS